MGSRRAAIAGLVGVLGLLAGAWALVASLTGPGAPPPGAPAPAPAAPPPAGAAAPPWIPPTSSEAPDRPEAERLARLEGRRELHRTLREAWSAAAPSPGARRRLEPALAEGTRGLDAGRWAIDCRGLVCRVEPERAPAGGLEALAAQEPLRAVADRIAHDPGGVDRGAYLLLPAAPQQRPADGLLAELEVELRGSAELAACLAAPAAARGSLAFDLQLDPSGITYGVTGDIAASAIVCASNALNDILGTTPVPPDVRPGSRRVVLREGR